MSLYDSAVQLAELSDKARKQKIDFMKQILLMASALLGALLAFYKKPDHVHTFHILFALALASFVLGILLLSVALFREVNSQERLLAKWKEQVRIHVETGKQPVIISVSPKKIFLVAEVSGYIMLSSSLLLFVIYICVF